MKWTPYPPRKRDIDRHIKKHGHRPVYWRKWLFTKDVTDPFPTWIYEIGEAHIDVYGQKQFRAAGYPGPDRIEKRLNTFWSDGPVEIPEDDE